MYYLISTIAIIIAVLTLNTLTNQDLGTIFLIIIFIIIAYFIIKAINHLFDGKGGRKGGVSGGFYM